MSADPPSVEAPPAAARRSGTSADLARLSALTGYWLGLSVLWGSISTIVLPRLIEQLVPPAVKTSALSLVAGLEAVVAIVVQPVAGAASDRIATPWGRRRPFIVAGVVAQLFFLLLLARAGAFWEVLVVMLLIELASNAAQGPYQGLLPDTVPPDRRGLASGLVGAAQLAGQVVGVAVAGVLVATGDEAGAIAFAGAAVALGMLTTVLGVDEPSVGTVSSRPSAWLRTLVLPRHWLRPARTMLFAVWGLDLRERRDYLWVLASRLAILMATGTLQPFIYFYLEDSLHLGVDAGPAVAPLAALVAFVALVSAIPGGALTRRWGRVRTVLVSALFGALGAAAFAVAPTYWSLFVIAIPFGVSLGVFLSADWALLVDLVPPGEAGRYLGLSNTATAGAGVLAVAIGGPVADLVNGGMAGAGYRAVFVLAAVEFLVGAWCVLHVPEPRISAAAS